MLRPFLSHLLRNSHFRFCISEFFQAITPPLPGFFLDFLNTKFSRFSRLILRFCFTNFNDDVQGLIYRCSSMHRFLRMIFEQSDLWIFSFFKDWFSPNFWKFFQVSDFERLPSSVGRFSTKFWLRDYEQFVEQDHDEADAPLPLDDLAAFEG